MSELVKAVVSVARKGRVVPFKVKNKSFLVGTEKRGVRWFAIVRQSPTDPGIPFMLDAEPPD